MTDVFKWLVDAFWHAFGVISETAVFEFFGRSVSIFDIFIAFIILGMFASVFWRGAQS